MDYEYSEDNKRIESDSKIDNNGQLIIIGDEKSFIDSIHEQISCHYNDYPDLITQDNGGIEYFFS